MDLDENGVTGRATPTSSPRRAEPGGRLRLQHVLCNIKPTNLEHRPGWDKLATSRSAIFRRDS